MAGTHTLHVATRKGLFTLHREGRGWQIGEPDFLGDNVSMLLSDPRDGALYAALEHGHFGPKLHRRLQGAEGWEEMATPAFPPKPEGVEDVDPVSQRPIPWTVMRIWALDAGPRNRPGELWCGTIPGGLFQSHDGGRKWELIRSLWDHPGRKQWMGGGADYPGIHTISLDPRDGRRIVLGVSTGGAWFTEDRGATWNCRGKGMRAAYMPAERAYDPAVQDIHCLARCTARPEVLWVQHHNGIFRSTDGAANWTELQAAPSSFGFAVAAHPKDPDTAWFVPGISDERRVTVGGRLVVTRTRDGGQTFEQLTTGLPQQHAYDIVYR
ncbi:MAG: exo-alpha-sialidase, partial [Gemmatimonadota bacterium]|nr:exo-alpha-sialidase [Gemmatimonadota bacterium]